MRDNDNAHSLVMGKYGETYAMRSVKLLRLNNVKQLQETYEIRFIQL